MQFSDILECVDGNKKTYNNLMRECSKGKIIPFIGAGLCIPPYLGWKDSLLELVSCHPSNYKLPLPSECLGLNVGANIVPFTVIGSFPSKTWNLKGARHI